MSIGSILNMARSGLNVQQAAIQTASQNISNAQTVGYSKQRVEMATTLETVFPYGTIGTGVQITNISRARDAMLDVTYRSDFAAQSGADTTTDALSQIQTIFNEPSDNGLSASLDAFWGAWNDLAQDPTNGAAKTAVRAAGDNVATTLNRFARQLDQLDQTNRESMNADVGTINSITQQVSKLNVQIVSSEADGHPAGDLRDSRDRLLDQLSGLAGGQIVERPNGSVAFYMGGRLLLDGSTARTIEMQDGQPPVLAFTGGTPQIDGVGGSLGAKMDISANRVPGVMSRLDSLAKGLVTTVNAIHSAGQIFTGTPPVGSPAGNFFDVTTPPPVGTDNFLTARGIKIAASLTGGDQVAASSGTAAGPGNTDTAAALANLQDSASLVNFTDASGAPVATSSFDTFFGSTVADLATSARYAEDDATVQKTLTSNIDTKRQSVSGVSTDEELMDVIQHQHAYQAAARLVNVVDEMTQTLVDLGR